jgi:tryptophan-rich sensory protein
MKLPYRILIFLIINFVALGIGGIYTNPGVNSEWYQSLAKAPWTPPGWVFGASWTIIMICFAIYLGYAWSQIPNHRYLLSLYVLQLILNISWNPVFFEFHNVLYALVIIGALTLLIAYFLFGHSREMKGKTWLVAPYLLWLLIATSLNAYIYWYN